MSTKNTARIAAILREQANKAREPLSKAETRRLAKLIAAEERRVKEQGKGER